MPKKYTQAEIDRRNELMVGYMATSRNRKADYCKEMGVNITTMRYWVKQYNKGILPSAVSEEEMERLVLRRKARAGELPAKPKRNPETTASEPPKIPYTIEYLRMEGGMARILFRLTDRNCINTPRVFSGWVSCKSGRLSEECVRDLAESAAGIIREWGYRSPNMQELQETIYGLWK